VFGAAAAEFVLWPRFGTSTYFLLALLSLVDFLTGVALRARRGTVVAAAPAVSRKSARAPAPVAEPQFDPAPAPAPTPAPAPAPAPLPPTAASVAESVLLDHPEPTHAQPVVTPAATPAASSPEVQSPDLQPGNGVTPPPEAPRH
jgi:hypothetical protein